MTSTTLQQLREITGAGVMECKKALDDAEGDLHRAQVLIKERGLARAEKKQERNAGAGLVTSYVHNGRLGVLLVLYAETDFVVRSEPFQELAHELSMHIAAMAPETVDVLLEQPYVKDSSITVDAFIKQATARVGERIRVDRFCRYEA